MNQLKMFKDSIYITEQDNAQKIYEDCLSIPCSSNLTEIELFIVTNAIKDFFSHG